MECECDVLEGLIFPFFFFCIMLNVILNKLYPYKTNKNKDYNFCITFFPLCDTFFLILRVGSKMLLKFFCQ